MHVFKNWMTGPWCVNSCPLDGRSRLASWVLCGVPEAFPMPPSCCEPCWSTWPPAVPSRRRSPAPNRPVGVTSRRWPCSRGFERPSNGCAGWPTRLGGAIHPVVASRLPRRAIDATTVSGPGSPGTDWRLHFSVNLEDLQCDFIEVTDVGGGETFRRIRWPPAICCWGIVLWHAAGCRSRRPGRRPRPGAGQPQGLAAAG